MSPPDFDPGAVIDAMAPLLGLAVAREHRAGVAANLRALAAMAALLLDPPPGDGAEPAPVFRPADPRGGPRG